MHGMPQSDPNRHEHVLTPNNPALAPRGGYGSGPPRPLRMP